MITPLAFSKQQQSLKESFERAQQWDKNNEQSKKIDQLIGEMIAVQNLPFNFVEGIGFRRLMQGVVPRYNLKGRKYFTDYISNELYGKVANKITQLIKDFKFMSFTTDIWSDPAANVSLLSLTCHGISEQFERKCIVLKCETFDDRHTGDVIAEKFGTMLDEWGIGKHQVHCMIRDQGSNMKRAMVLSDLRDMDCTVHKLHLVVKTGLKSQQNICDVKMKLKKIATHFNHSATAQNKLKKIQTMLNQPHLTVFQDCATRWSSTFYMFERFLKLKDALTLYSNDCDMDPILTEEWKIVQSCIEILKPFEQATRELSSLQTLISSVIPIVHMLEKKIDQFLGSGDSADLTRTAATKIKSEIAAKFGLELENNHLFTIATYLDPRFKHKIFSPVLEEKIKNEILKQADDPITSSNDNRSAKRLKLSTSTSCPAAGESLACDLAELLGSSGEEDEEEETTSSLKTELSSYRRDKRMIDVSASPLNWWADNYQRYPKLSQIARRFLSPPPGSVPSEQLFSGAGLIYEPLRNRLESEKAAVLLFIKYNLPLLKFNC